MQVLFSLLLVLLVSCSESPPPYRSTMVPAVEWGKGFVLTAQDGKRFDTASLNGKVQVLFFGFTHCPDICSPTLAKLVQVRKALGADASSVQVLFVTVDPEHDTPPQLRTFLGGFDPSFIGLTGSAAETQAVARDHKIFSQAGKDSISHSGTLLAKDARGRVRLVMRESLSAQDLAHDLRLLLRE